MSAAGVGVGVGRIAVLCLLLVIPGFEADADPAPAAGRESVILLHGLGRTARSMDPLARFLSEQGFDVINFGYPSRQEGPEALTERLRVLVASCCSASPRVHFVGHSLGGILVRRFLADEGLENAGRLVMLGPPNRGSEIVDEVGDLALFRWAMGPTATQLGTSSESLPNRLPLPAIEVGVIAGTGSVNWIGSVLIPDEDDGMVSVERAQFEGMTDFLKVSNSHTFMMRSSEVARQVVHFLKEGRFDHSKGSAGPLLPE